MRSSEVILGPPGCGKTHTLIKRLTNIIGLGQDPTQVTVASFTKAAAAEISKRAGVANVKIGTLHSMAFKMAGINTEQVIDREWLELFSSECGIVTRGVGRQELEDLSEGDAYLALYAYMGAARLDNPSQVFLNSPCDGTLEKWLYWHESYRDWKKSYGVIDFNDMIERAVGANPGADVLVLDEAQDFSPLQWVLIESMLPNVVSVVMAGDDDQAIYKWSGADPHGMAKFIKQHKPTVTILNQSHRVPRSVHKIALKVISNVAERLKKEYKPRDEEGCITKVATFSMLDVMEDEDTLILVRNHILRANIEDTLMRRGVVYKAEGGYPAPLENRHAQCVKLWMAARKNLQHMGHAGLTSKQLHQIAANSRGVYRQLVQDNPEELLGQGVTWGRLLQMPSNFANYYAQVLKKHHALSVPTRITICTMHASKGREADRVIVVNGMGERTQSGFEKDPDSEFRTFYVAVTRSKHRLDIVQDIGGLTVLS